MSPAAVIIVLAVGPLATVISARAEEATIAVAANFREAAIEIRSAFESSSGNSLTFTFGSTGQLYAQIAHGAPFDAFLAADSSRAARTIQEGLGVPGTQFTYAVGRIALFSADDGVVSGPNTLRGEQFRRLAIAQPSTAPYGAAAVEVMKTLRVYEHLSRRIVTGLSVAQAYQFVQSGNAALGFVALAQIARHSQGSRWVVPSSLHLPIRQDAVLLERGNGNDAAEEFLSFLRSREAGAILDTYGYSRSE